jgi:hypothetical protein
MCIFYILVNYWLSRFTDYLTCLTATFDTSPFLNTLHQFKGSETITFTTISQQLITNYLQEYKIYTLKKNEDYPHILSLDVAHCLKSPC